MSIGLGPKPRLPDDVERLDDTKACSIRSVLSRASSLWSSARRHGSTNGDCARNSERTEQLADAVDIMRQQ